MKDMMREAIVQHNFQVVLTDEAWATWPALHHRDLERGKTTQTDKGQPPNTPFTHRGEGQAQEVWVKIENREAGT